VLFLSTVVHKIDKKGRVSFPAHFRSSLKDSQLLAIVVYRSLKGAYLEGCPVEVFERRCQHNDVNGLDAESAFLFAEAQLVHFDSEGRLSLPKILLDYAGIHDQMTFVGRGRTFEVWQPEAFEKSHEKMRQILLQQSGESQ
jgi:MraZ protein